MQKLETQERKMNKDKEKEKGLTHFLGHYLLYTKFSVYWYQSFNDPC